MKKLLNHTKRPISEWEDSDGDKFDWDDEGAYTDSEAVQDGGMYYAESGNPEDYVEESEEGHYQEEYYEEETSEEGYYEGETYEEGTNEEGYYEGEAYKEGTNEEGYYEGEAYEEGTNEEGYYEGEAYEEGTNEEGYYEGEAYEEGAYEEGYYEEESYEEDMGEAVPPMLSMEEDAGEFRNMSAANSGTKKRKRRRGLAGMGMMDRMILGTGAAVLVLALVTVGFYISSRIIDRQISSFVSVGKQLDGIDVIGEAGLLAVADAQLARMAASDILNGNQQGYQGNEGYNESEYRRDVTVTMEFVSIQKDLKIKFVNDSTGKLVANVPFAVQVTDPDGKSFIWSDDDMDGIIYKKDITPGSYKVVMEALADERYSSYTLSTLARTVEVKKDIAYEKVEVANEIKSEDEIDASKEDTAQNDTVVESALQDTVAWVESKIIDGTYVEVDKSKIANPMSVLASSIPAQASGMGGVVLTTEGDTVSGNTGGESTDTPTPTPTPDADESTTPSPSPSVSPSPTVTPEPKMTLTPSTVITVVGGTVYSQVDVENMPGAKYSIDGSSLNNDFATVSVDNTGMITITGRIAGTTQIIVVASYSLDGKEYSAQATLKVTVNPAKTITFDRTGVAFIGEPLVLSATVTDAVTPVFKATSSNDSIATVSVKNNQITVNGLKEGTVTITVELWESNTVTGMATCSVTVMAHPKNDKVTKLTDTNDNQLYVQENGKYREAVYADYYIESNKFYLLTEPKYTGWQTINGKVYYFTADGKYVTGEQVIQGAKYNFASDGSLVTGSGMLGIDVSKWNSNIDWKAVKNSGVNYVIIRCGYRGSSAGSLIEDPMFKTNIQGAISAGIKVGIYFFTQAMDEREAVEEASMVLELVKNYKISYPIFLDVESSGGRADAIDKATRTAVCKAFCQTIQSKGYTAGIYANKSWLETKLDPTALSAYKIWLAQYRATPTYTGRYDLWQYSSTGRINGISGDVDMNLSYLGY